MSASTEGQDEGHSAGILLSANFHPFLSCQLNFLVISQPTVNLNKSQLMFFLNFIFVFFIKISQTLASINIRCSAPFATT